MSEIVTEISGQVVVDLCAALNIRHDDVYEITIRPAGVLVVHVFRRNVSGQMFVTGADVAKQSTDVKIDWSALHA